MKRANLTIAVLALLTLAAAVSAAPIIMDDGDAGTSQQRDIYAAAFDPLKAVNGDNAWTHPNATAISAYYSYQFDNLTAPAYDVYVTWPKDRMLSPYWALGNSATPFTVVNGGAVNRGWPDWTITPGGVVLDQIAVDQSVNAAGFDYNGYSWFKLGRYAINAPVLSLIGTNFSAAQGQVLFDAAMIIPVPEPATMALLGLGAAALLRRRR